MILAVASSVFIFVLFFFQCLRLGLEIRQTNRRINIIQSAVDGLDRSKIHIDHHNVQPSIEGKIKDSESDLVKYWVEFEESLVITDNRIENTLDAEHFFHDRNLAHRIFHNRTYENTPQLLVGFGVLFTFIGLVIGLTGISLDSENVEVLKNGIESLINGAQLAFVSSIAGISFSLLFSLFHHISQNSVLQKIQTLQKSINFKYPRTNPEKSLAYIRESSKESSNVLGSLSEQLGQKLQDVVRDISGEIGKGIQDSLKPFLEQITDQAMNSSESVMGEMMETFLEKVSAAGEEQQRFILETNQAIQEALVDFRRDFTGQVIELKDAIENLNESYHFIEENLITKFDGVINDFSEAIDGYKEEQRTFISQIEKQSVTAENLTLVSNEIRQLLNQMNEQVGNSIGAYRQAIQNLELVYSANNDASEKLTAVAQSFEQPLRELENSYQELQKNLQSTAEAVKQNVEQTLKSYFTQVEKQTNQRLREWNNQTTAFSTSMLSVTTQLNTLVENISKNLNGEQ